METHLSVPRLLALAEDAVPETEELEHLVKCRTCFDVMTSFLRDRRNERTAGTAGSS
jgi:hypothetical protein